MKTRQQISFGAGSVSKDLLMGMSSSYLLFFYTEVVGIAAYSAGLIMMAIRIFDAANDPVIGVIIDNASTKNKIRSAKFLLLAIPMNIFGILMFIKPNLNDWQLIVYLLVTYMFMGVFFSFYDITLLGVVPKLTNSRELRGKIYSLSRFFTSLSFFIVNVAAFPLIKWFSKTITGSDNNLETGFMVIMMCFSLLAVSTAINVYSVVRKILINKEKNLEKAFESNSSNSDRKYKSFRQLLRDYLTVIASNRSLLLLYSITMLNIIGGGIGNGINLHYLRFVLQKEDMISLQMIIAFAGTVISYMLAPRLLKRMSPNKLLKRIVSISMVANLLNLIIGRQFVPAFLTLNAINSLASGITMISLMVLLNHNGDLIENKIGSRMDNSLFALNAFSIKLGSAFSGGLSGVLLTFAGYTSQSTTQTAATINSINIIRFAGPVIGGIIIITALGMISRREADRD